MKFLIKTFKIPVDRTSKEVAYKEMELKNNQVNVEDIHIDSTQLITIEAKNIANFNNAQLKMASLDESIKFIRKKVLCKTNK